MMWNQRSASGWVLMCNRRPASGRIFTCNRRPASGWTLIAPGCLSVLALISGCGEEAAGPARDAIPPAAVRDLAIATGDSVSVTLTWTASGDDSTIGTASRYDLRFADSDTVPWAGMLRVPNPPAPKATGLPETLRVFGLVPKASYRFLLRTADEVPNWGPLSNVLEVTPDRADHLPPAAVGDLTAVEATPNSVLLTWTAPGDDGTRGTAAQYDIRYSPATITEGNWPTAVPVAGAPFPRPAGKEEDFSPSGLLPNTRYFFALKTRDSRDNWSEISNVTAITTGRAEDAHWWGGFGPSPDGQGLDGGVYSMLVHGDALVVAGAFTRAGALPANHIAAWDGRSWTALDSGTNGDVSALAEYQGYLVAGGSFTTAGRAQALHVSFWDGAAWGPMGELDGNVTALLSSGNDLYAGGAFEHAGGVAAHHIARFVGQLWQPVGDPPLSDVYSLAMYNGQLFAAGAGWTSNPDTVLLVARWDGAAWQTILTGVSGPGIPELGASAVRSLRVFGDRLVAGGSGVSFQGSWETIGAWDGTTWEPLSSGIEEWAYEPVAVGIVGIFQGCLVAGGLLTVRQPFYSGGIARLEGGQWLPFGSGAWAYGDNVGVSYPAHVMATAEYGGSLYIGGEITAAGRLRSMNIARWDP